jgi:hypothetical protein
MRREAANGLRVASLTDKGFRATLEACVAGGHPLLIENVEEQLDPLMDPLLEKKFLRKGECACGGRGAAGILVSTTCEYVCGRPTGHIQVDCAGSRPWQ